MTKQWALYDILIDDALAYVGITDKPEQRLSQHKVAGTVPYFATLKIVQWFDSRSEAALAERKRIKELKPPRNVRDADPSVKWIGREPWVVHV